jgi:hypothetical protein
MYVCMYVCLQVHSPCFGFRMLPNVLDVLSMSLILYTSFNQPTIAAILAASLIPYACITYICSSSKFSVTKSASVHARTAASGIVDAFRHIAGVKLCNAENYGVYTYVCMYNACMHVCVHVMYACMYICMYACMYVCMYVCEQACAYGVFVFVCRVAAFPRRHAGLIHTVKSRMVYSTNWQHWEAVCVCVRAWCGAVTIWTRCGCRLAAACTTRCCLHMHHSGTARVPKFWTH